MLVINDRGGDVQNCVTSFIDDPLAKKTTQSPSPETGSNFGLVASKSD